MRTRTRSASPSGSDRSAGRDEVAALFDEGLEEPEDEQRVALGPAAEPVDQLRFGRRRR